MYHQMFNRLGIVKESDEIQIDKLIEYDIKEENIEIKIEEESLNIFDGINLLEKCDSDIDVKDEEIDCGVDQLKVKSNEDLDSISDIDVKEEPLDFKPNSQVKEGASTKEITPYRCNVPLSNDNSGGSNISVFTLPKQRSFVEKWLEKIRKKDFPTKKNPQMCKFLFTDSGFETQVYGRYDKTGKMISVPLKVRVLKGKPIPSGVQKNPVNQKYNILPNRQSPRKGSKDENTDVEMSNSESGISARISSCKDDDNLGKVKSMPLKVRVVKGTIALSDVPKYPINQRYILENRQSPINCSGDESTDAEMSNSESDISARISSSKEDDKKDCKLNNLSDVKKCIENLGVSKFWTFHNDSSSLLLLHIKPDPEPFIQFCVKINSNMDLTMSTERNPVVRFMNYSFPIKVQFFSDLTNILSLIENNLEQKNGQYQVKSVVDLIVNLLENIRTDKNENVIKFIQKQLNLLLSSRNNFRYSTDFLIFACILKTISSHAYNFICESESNTLPDPDILRQICDDLKVFPKLEINDEKFLMYIRSRINTIKEEEKFVIVSIDEINIKPYLKCEGETIDGVSDTNKFVTSAFVFMVSSILSPFKEVAYILPICSINFKFLHELIKKIIVGLENLGLIVICVVTGNNSINGRAMSLFVEPSLSSIVYPHPVNQNRPLFSIIDSLHNLNSIRSDWLSQENEGTCLFYPDFNNPQYSEIKIASFMVLEKVCKIEGRKHSKELTSNNTAPTNLEKQNVNSVLKIFNKFVIKKILSLGPRYRVKHYEDTAVFIDIFCKWWDIFNVKSLDEGIQRNVYMEPLDGNELDEKYIFLSKFLTWLDAWDNLLYKIGALSKETHEALGQTTHGMLELTRYCIDECKMKYILTGKIQTDHLEARFGNNGQMAGSMY